MAGQQLRNTGEEIIGEWMLFFFNCLEELLQKLEEKYGRYLNTGGYLNDRQKSLLDLVRERGAVRLPDAVQHFPAVSERTLKRDLRLLESELLIAKLGKGKAVTYQVAK
jgi:hypothetical protein